jgi:tetratricopeptide (TPR) repeat protein
MNRRLIALVVALGFLVAIRVVDAQPYKPGDHVVVIQHAALRNDQQQEVCPVGPGLLAPVREVKGDSLLLNPGIPGWLDAEMVIPADRRAIERLTTMLEAKPQLETPNNLAAIYTGRAALHSKFGQHELAIADYDEAIRLAPSSIYFLLRGFSRLPAKQYDQAINDANEATKLTPDSWMAFVIRGYARRGKNEFDRAIEEFDAALRLNPQLLELYAIRGHTWGIKREFAKAIDDCNEALRRDPKLAMAFTARGNIRLIEGKVDQALDDFNEALRIEPMYVDAYNYRGTSRFLRRDPEAVADFRRVIELEQGRNDFTTYAALLGYFAARHRNDDAGAEKFLADGAKPLKPDEWPAPIFEHLRGKRDEAALLKLAADDDQRTEARYFLGLAALAQGRKPAAREHFRWAVDRGNKSSREYTFAEAELKRLDAAK